MARWQFTRKPRSVRGANTLPHGGATAGKTGSVVICYLGELNNLVKGAPRQAVHNMTSCLAVAPKPHGLEERQPCCHGAP